MWGRLRASVTRSAAPTPRPAPPTWHRRACRPRANWRPNYFVVRQTDAQNGKLLASTIEGYQRVAADHAEPLRAPASPPSPTCCRRRRNWRMHQRSTPLSLARQRAQFEHAIAISAGQVAPADFTLASRAVAGHHRARDSGRRAVARCCSAGPISPPPSGAWRRPMSRSAWRAFRLLSEHRPDWLRGQRGGSARVGPVQRLERAMVVRPERRAKLCSTPAPRAPAWPARKRGSRQRWRATARRCSTPLATWKTSSPPRAC